MKWGDGLRTNPGALWAAAQRLTTTRNSLNVQAETLEGLDVPGWEGEAAERNRETRKKIAEQLRRRLEYLPPMIDALNSGGDSFRDIQEAQKQLIERAREWNFTIRDDGTLDYHGSFWQGLGLGRASAQVYFWSSIKALVVRLNFTDFSLAAKLKFGRTVVNLKQGAEDAVSGLRGLISGAADGLAGAFDWVKGKIADGLSWDFDIGEFVESLPNRFLMAGKAFKRAFEQGSNPDWVRELFQEGKLPNLSELGGGALLFGGRLGSAISNFVANDDLHFLDDGRPYYARPDEMRRNTFLSHAVDGAQEMLSGSLWQVLSRDKSDPDGRAEVEVKAIVGRDGKVRYTVDVPCTTESFNEWTGWSGHRAGTDWTANAQGVANGNSAATESIRHAISMAIDEDMRSRGMDPAKHKPDVLLLGHSQGGIISSNIAADESFNSKFNVRGVIAMGSPVDTINVPKDVPTYTLQNQFDPIPRVDFGGAPVAKNHAVNIVFPDPEGWGKRVDLYRTHGQELYQLNINELTSGNGTPENLRKYQEMEKEFSDFTRGTYDGSISVPYGRETD